MSLDVDTEEYSAGVARVLKARRLAADLSMTRLAKLAGMSQQMISFVERGTRTPTVATLYRVAQALKTDPASLLLEAQAALAKSCACCKGSACTKDSGNVRG
jgi:transcriptional regulator with XRE-family HTH domain